MRDPNRDRSREEHVFLAKLADYAERYQEMLKHMKKITAKREELTTEERNLLSNAYKNLIGSRRTSWRIVSALYRKEEKRGYKEQTEMVKEYRIQIASELVNICLDVVTLVDKELLPYTKLGEAKVFYHKLKGDYYRYLAEFTEGDERKRYSDLALKAYTEASNISRAELDPIDSTRMGLALNYSVFHYEILNQAENATTIARQALDDALPELQKLTGDSHKDATLLIQLLRDNLSLWAERPKAGGINDDDDDYYY